MNDKFLNYSTWVINKLSQSYLYNNWDDGFSRLELKNTFKEFYKMLASGNVIDLNTLTKEDALELGFKKLNDKSDLYLMPLYIIPLIPKGTELVTKDGEVIIFNSIDDIKDINLDINLDCLSYGIRIKEVVKQIENKVEKIDIEAKVTVEEVNTQHFKKTEPEFIKKNENRNTKEEIKDEVKFNKFWSKK